MLSCPKEEAFRCPHCGGPRSRFHVTCGASECQEANYIANRERNAQAKRRRKSRAG